MLKINTSNYQAIRGHGEDTYPNECCGILVGTIENGRRAVCSVIRCDNTRTDSHRRYNIDPRELIRVQRDAHERGLEIIGFYHSHPDHAAEWSPTDLEEAHWIGCSYVITRVESGKAAETNSFVLAGSREEDKALVQEEIIVGASF